MNTMQRREAMKSYILAANLLPERLWREAFRVPEHERMLVEELRLRLGRPLTAVIAGVQRELPGAPVTAEELELTVAGATELSYHSYEQQMRQGFVTVAGGHRIGLCGALSPGGVLTELTSVDIRIARALTGIADELTAALLCGGAFESTLIVSRPGVGKTTLLRDICRILSRTLRVAVADCRSELAGPGSDLARCDVLRGGDKAESIERLLRALSPDVICVDEITAESDADALIRASYTGCAFLASAHASSLLDLERRPIYRRLTESGMFRRVLLLEREGVRRICRICERGDTSGQAAWRIDDRRFLLADGAAPEPGDGGAQTRAAAPDHGAAGDQDRDPVPPHAAAGAR